MYVTLPLDHRPATSRVGSWEAAVILVQTCGFSVCWFDFFGTLKALMSGGYIKKLNPSDNKLR